MAGDDTTRDDGRRPIFTGDDLPAEDPIAPAMPPEPPRWDDDVAANAEADAGFTTAPGMDRLGLDDGEERLPWLESADDITPDEGFDSGRVIGFLLLSVLALAMIIGAVWWVSNRSGDTPADGSTIRAEAGPYKVAPSEPGGKTFAGTGDTSYAVAQGEARPGTVSGGTPAPAPKPTATASPTPSTSAPAPAPVSGIGVQVGAYTSAADAEAGWSALVARNSVLSGVGHRVVEGQADFGRVFRLQAVAGNLAAANALCSQLKAAGQGCQVKR